MSEIFNNARVLLSTSTSLGTRDFSNRTMKVELTRDADEHDDTVMGLTARSRVIGLEKWSFKMDIIMSLSTADGGENSDNILHEIYTRNKAGGKVLVYVRKDTTAVQGPSNVAWQGLCVLKNYNPLSGSVGDLLKTVNVEFLGSDNLTRLATSS